MTVISRVLKLNDGNHEVDVPVRIFCPEFDKSAWSCRWEILWPGRTRSNDARGTDSILALFNALQMIGSELYCSDAHRSGRLFWTKDWAGYGFPVPDNIRDLMMEDDKRYL